MYDFGLTDEQFWALTPPQFSALSRRHEQTAKRQDFGFGLVCSTIANANGGKKEGGHFTAQDFMPKYGDEEPTTSKEMTPDQILAHMKAAFPKNDNGKKKLKRTLVPKGARGG